MKPIALMLSLLILGITSRAQGIYNNGARIVSETGTSWVISGGNITLTSQSATNLASVDNLKIESGATLTLTSASFLTVGGTLQNSGTLTGPSGSTVTLSGSSAQAITGIGTSTFGNLTLNNTNGLTLTNAGITVNGTLDLANGILTTGANSATLGSSGSITNASSSKYVYGKLAQTFSSTGSKVFPIGKGSNYRPLTFQYTVLTGSSTVTVEQFESGLSGTLPANISLLTTNRSWTVSQTGGSNMQYFVSLDATGYTPASTVVMLKKDAGTIVSYATTSPNYTNADALTSFSDFGLGEPAGTNPIDGGTIAADQSICYGAVPAALTNSALPSGQTGSLEYKWQYSTTNATSGFADIASSNTEGFSPGALIAATWFKRIAKNSSNPDWSESVESNVVHVSVDAYFGGTLSSSASVCSGITTTTLSISGYTGAIVKWQYSTDNWVTINDFSTTLSEITATGLPATTKFRAFVQLGSCLNYSNDVTVTL